jgi:hypothetical protein
LLTIFSATAAVSADEVFPMSNRLSIATLVVIFGLPALVARQVPMARQDTSSEARWQELMDEGRRPAFDTPEWALPQF